MFGLDEQVASLGEGEAFLIVAVVAILLGLRHASDPDHLTAVSMLVASEEDRQPRRAATLGLSWGAGHATTLFAFGLPIVLFDSFLPEPVQRAAEVAIGVVIIVLALRLLVRWRRGYFHAHIHEHDGERHAHLHMHEHSPGSHARAHEHKHGAALGRSPVQAYAIGLVHVFENEVLQRACRGERLHLLGLVSAGGVHASIGHLKALIELAGRQEVDEVVIHAFTDGRDTNPDSGAGYIAEVEGWGGARIATVSGRYYAMDRDKREERTQLALDALVDGEAEFSADTGEEAVRAAYERGETDEFIKPTLVGEEGRIRPDDSAVFFNFRPDRARQLTEALADDVKLTTLTEYREHWDYPAAFPPARPEVTLASTLADRGIAQLHVAETEKYAHVTYFFNGGEEDEYEGEEHRLVDSPRDVATYDKKPEMSAAAATDVFVECWREGDFGFGLINFANPDMVGHTGVIEAAVKAIETVDECLGRVVDAVEESEGVCLITADHGNADHMLEDDGSPNTAHSMNPVPLIVTADVGDLREGGILADVAPTVLDLLGLLVPEEMSGEKLTKND